MTMMPWEAMEEDKVDGMDSMNLSSCFSLSLFDYALVIVGLYALVRLCTCRRCNGLVWTVYALVCTCMHSMHLYGLYVFVIC